jgi:hypothetical protein
VWLEVSSIINTDTQQVEIVGPLLPEEGRAAFDGYTFASKAAHPCAQWLPQAQSPIYRQDSQALVKY